MATLEQWSVRRDSPEEVLTAGHSYGLKNTDVDRYVRYGERDYGINLVSSTPCTAPVAAVLAGQEVDTTFL